MDHEKDIRYTMEKIADSYDTNTETLKEFFKLLIDIQSKLLLNERCTKDIEKNIESLMSIAYEIINTMKKTSNEDLEEYISAIKEKMYDYKSLVDKIKEETSYIEDNSEMLKEIDKKLSKIEDNTGNSKFINKAIFAILSVLTFIAGGLGSFKVYQYDNSNAKMEKAVQELKDIFLKEKQQGDKINK